MDLSKTLARHRNVSQHISKWENTIFFVVGEIFQIKGSIYPKFKSSRDRHCSTWVKLPFAMPSSFIKVPVLATQHHCSTCLFMCLGNHRQWSKRSDPFCCRGDPHRLPSSWLPFLAWSGFVF